MMNKITQKWKGQISLLFIICSLLFSVSACSDFFDQESDHVIYSDHAHLNNAVDTVSSVMGIFNKLQVIADRTILLGEVRGDLVDLTSTASSDLRDIALFNAGDDNQYNQPRDYYAIINNCNYYIANADTALQNNRSEYIFMAEYAAVKAIRAWTYLQLALNYGSVPFVDKPILTKEESERDYPSYDLQAICQYFINDLAELPERYDTEYPFYGDKVRGNDSRVFFFPLNIVRGDLNLWAGNYREAALCYYKYISRRNGTVSTYPVGTSFLMWTPGSTTWTGRYISDMYNGQQVNLVYGDESYGSRSELITMIPGDSIRAEGYYSELRNLFNSNSDNDYHVSINPSPRMEEISESQVNCVLSASGNQVSYAPVGLNQHRTGDLRLSLYWNEGYRIDNTTGLRVETQNIGKYTTRNVHIYRRQMVYLRMAEALNQAGYPRMAFLVLSQGMNDATIASNVLPYCDNAADSAFVQQFSFPSDRYGLMTVGDVLSGNYESNHNTIGMHTRGSGWTPMNEYYQLPEDTLLTAAALNQRQQQFVDSLILNEGALEFCFEGTRFYDLMRFALRSDTPGAFMAKHVYARKGKDNAAQVQGEIKKDLTTPRNWYLNWGGKLGL